MRDIISEAHKLKVKAVLNNYLFLLFKVSIIVYDQYITQNVFIKDKHCMVPWPKLMLTFLAKTVHGFLMTF